MKTSIESARGCGYRKPGGLYLVSGQLAEPCPRLPLRLDRCPHCGQGIGPARGWTWVEPATVAPAQPHGRSAHNDHCPIGIDAIVFTNVENAPHRMGDRAGLIWVGEKFYPTPEAFMAEAAVMGVSRRIKAVPRGFEVGKDWVFLGHRKAISHVVIDSTTTIGDQASIDHQESREEFSPGIITLFKPTAIEYVVKGDETDEQLADLEQRGITPVKVVRDVDAAEMPA